MDSDGRCFRHRRRCVVTEGEHKHFERASDRSSPRQRRRQSHLPRNGVLGRTPLDERDFEPQSQNRDPLSPLSLLSSTPLSKHAIIALMVEAHASANCTSRWALHSAGRRVDDGREILMDTQVLSGGFGLARCGWRH